MTQITIDESCGHEIDNDDRLRVLGIVDQFRELGINEDISLPQLAVFGDQSSGKSSLLEGITGLSFPIASDLCTRFVTQIVLRRAPESEPCRISIIAGPTTKMDEAQVAQLAGFDRALEGDKLTAEEFGSILDEAAIRMGLPSSNAKDLDTLPKRFSDDVLKIELTGPQYHHLSVVDVPGLFHNPTKYQTEEDLKIIRALIETYMTDPRTIILAVMDARNNLANQEVFRIARAADPPGRRTVGIITKCDALQEGDEEMVLRIAQNAVEMLTHGWFVVKNRSTKDIQDGVTISQRHANEQAFFRQDPWSKLPRDRVGVEALQKFLGKLLYDHIRDEFPELIEEIRSKVEEAREELDGLGPPRQNSVQQRQFLSRLARRYEQTVQCCLKGDYDATWESEDPRKLRMRLQIENDAFASRLKREGHTCAFRKADNERDEEFPQREKNEDIYEWIRQQYRESRGSELPGTVNPNVLERIFRVQAKGWRVIAERHVQCVDKLVLEFNERTMQDVSSDTRLRQKLTDRNQQATRCARDDAKAQLAQILRDEMEGILQTVNHYFADNLASIRQERVTCRLKKVGFDGESNQQILSSLNRILEATHLSNEQQAVYDIHDILKAYYRVAMKRFCDNVVMQVVERCYLGHDGPVKRLSAEYIGSLTDRELSDIAEETYTVSTTRNEVTARLGRLEKALAIAEREQR